MTNRTPITGNPDVLVALQLAVSAEVHLNAQYRADWRLAKFLGVKKTAKKLHSFGDDAHCWAKKVSDRLLFLGGKLNYPVSGIMESETLTAMFENELSLELAIVAPYEQTIQTAMKALDDTTRNLIEHLLKWHQSHVGWLAQQLSLIEAMDEAEYIAEKL